MAVRLYPTFNSEFPDDAALFFNACVILLASDGEITDIDIKGYLQARDEYLRSERSFEDWKKLVEIPAWDVLNHLELFGFGKFINPLYGKDPYCGSTENQRERNSIIIANPNIFADFPTPLLNMIDGFHWS